MQTKTVVRSLLTVIAIALGIVVLSFATFVVLWKLGDMRFARQAPSGTAQPIVRQRLGRPAFTAPVPKMPKMPKGSVNMGLNGCGDADRECWYYVSQTEGDHFVCFDEAKVVTCTGRALMWH